MSQMPKDPVMLLSFVNTQLRDNYSSLEELCSAMDAESAALISTLEMIDYHYDRDLNKFI